MFKINLVIVAFSATLMLYSCSRKTQPSQSTAATVENDSSATVVKTAPVKAKIKTAVPRVIIVNDKVASKSVDGRYYYDLQGHRYWRNNKDGKYYLFHKSMFDDEAFKAKGN